MSSAHQTYLGTKQFRSLDGLRCFSILLVLWQHTVARQLGFGFAAFATYTSDWFVPLTQPATPFSFAWSLATEEQFYLVWPFLLRLLGKRYAHGAVAIFLLAAPVTRWAGQGPDVRLPLYERILRSLSFEIGLGVLLALLLDDPRSFDVLRRAFRHRGVTAAAMAVLLGATVPNLIPFGLTSVAMAALMGTLVTVPLAVAVAEVSFRLFESRFLRLRDRFRHGSVSSAPAVALPASTL